VEYVVAFSLEKFEASLECMAGESMMSTSLWRMWEKRAEKVCQKVLDLADKFLDESGRE
jgi:hypothetical protein